MRWTDPAAGSIAAVRPMPPLTIPPGTPIMMGTPPRPMAEALLPEDIPLDVWPMEPEHSLLATVQATDCRIM